MSLIQYALPSVSTMAYRMTMRPAMRAAGMASAIPMRKPLIWNQ